MPLFLATAQILASASVNLNLLTLIDEQGDLDHGASLQRGGLGHIGGGVTLDAAVVVDELNRYGVQDSQITVIMALGSHRYMTDAEIEERVGTECYSRLRVMNHEYDNPREP